VTALFPKPPSLMTQKVPTGPTVQLFHRPMRGQNSDAEPRTTVDARDIWSVILYIREMQKWSRSRRAPARPPAAPPRPSPPRSSPPRISPPPSPEGSP